MPRIAVQPKVLSRRCWLNMVLAGLCLAPTARAGDLRFKRHVLNADTDYCAACVIDVNHDGKLDIVCGGDWYEGPSWKKHFVADIPKIGGRPDGFSHLAFDVNRDGWTDVITVNYRSSSIKWMEHPGPSLGPWKAHTAVEPGSMETGRLVDVDGDGNLDLLPNGARFAAWWEIKYSSPGPGEPEWIRHELPREAGGHGIGFGDVDRDGRGDIIGQFGWLKAPADARTGVWHWNAEFSLERASVPLIVVDVDEDGDSDIVWGSAHGFGVYWLEQIKDQDQQRDWVRHAIDTSWSQGHSPLWADLDGDGRGELIVGKRYMAHGGADPGEYDPLAVYRYQYDPKTRAWNRWIMSPYGERVGLGLDPKVVDIDLDGDLDLMASGRSGLYILENLGSGESPKKVVTAPQYADHANLLVLQDGSGNSSPIKDPETWGMKRAHILDAIESTIGALPGAHERVLLDVKASQPTTAGSTLASSVSYQIDRQRRVSADLFVPANARVGAAPGIVCMFAPAQAALAKQVGQDLAARQYVCLVPQLAPSPAGKEIADQMWQAIRAADVLQGLRPVHGERIGFVGDALDGQLGLYVAAFDQRFIAAVVDARPASKLDALANPKAYSLSELLASVAPRAALISAPANGELAAELTRQAGQAAPVFALRNVAANLRIAPSTDKYGLLGDNRDAAYTWLDGQLRRGGGGGAAKRPAAN